eukprot:EG_transcript_10440
MADDVFKCQSLYAVLGLTAAATPEDIKAQHRQLALRWHPDKWVAAAEAERAAAEETFKMVSAAYMVLSDPVKRRKYDEGAHPSASVADHSPSAYTDEDGPRLILVSLWTRQDNVVRSLPWAAGAAPHREAVARLLRAKLGQVTATGGVVEGHWCLDIPASVYRSAFARQPFMQVPLPVPEGCPHFVRVIAPPAPHVALATLSPDQPLPLMACPGVGKAVVAVHLTSSSSSSSSDPQPPTDDPAGPTAAGLPGEAARCLAAAAFCHVAAIHAAGPVAFCTVDRLTHRLLFRPAAPEAVLPLAGGRWARLRAVDAAGEALTETMVVRCMLSPETGEDPLALVFGVARPKPPGEARTLVATGKAAAQPATVAAPPKPKVVSHACSCFMHLLPLLGWDVVPALCRMILFCAQSCTPGLASPPSGQWLTLTLWRLAAVWCRVFLKRKRD